MSAAVEAAFKEAIESKKLPAIGAVVLDVNGKELFKATCGSNDINDPSAPPFKSTTRSFIFSCSKLVTSVAALQLVEQGKLALDDSVEQHLPWLSDIPVLKGIDDNGKPILEGAKSKPTILNLMTHTAGLSYDFIDRLSLQWRLSTGMPPSAHMPISTFDYYKSPMVHEAGARFTYGINTDYLGFVIEAVSGLRIDQYIKKHITDPLGLVSTEVGRSDSENMLYLHLRDDKGVLNAAPTAGHPENPEVVGGGHYLVSTLDEYAEFLLTILNDGTNPKTGTKILDKTTVQDYIFTDYIPKICSNNGIAVFDDAVPQMTNKAEILPGVAKGWSCGLMLNNEDLPQGRPKGSGSWAGLGNWYYWIDRKNGKLGLIGTAVLPFLDPEVLYLYDALERSVYGHDLPDADRAKGATYTVERTIDGSI